MMKYYNPNPQKKNVGDCVIRAISKALNIAWDDVYVGLCVYGFSMCDMPSSNAVWGAYLQDNGFERHILPNICPNCYSIADFAADNPIGRYIVATGTHAVAVIDGIIWDSWNSENETPIYYFVKEVDKR